MKKSQLIAAFELGWQAHDQFQTMEEALARYETILGVVVEEERPWIIVHKSTRYARAMYFGDTDEVFNGWVSKKEHAQRFTQFQRDGVELPLGGKWVKA